MSKRLKYIKNLFTVFGLVFLFILIVLFLGQAIFNLTYQFPGKVKFGVTFSQKYASQLSGDWRDVYMKILDDLKVGHLRISSYWDEIEKSPSQFNFGDLDFMISQAEKREVKVILVLGTRQPRWPECHIPDWAKKFDVSKRQQKILEFIGRVVERYKNHTAIYAWQVENEPLLSSFGEGCDPPDKDFLRQEVELVRQLNGKPIIVTDSGELGSWITPMRLSDIFGTTLYRKVYDQTFGYVTYPFPPYFYNLKSTVVRAIFAKNNKKTIISELQSEPWSSKNGQSFFSVEEFKKNVNFAKQTGLDEIYLWGVEWWYFMEKQGHPQYLEFAKTIFK